MNQKFITLMKLLYLFPLCISFYALLSLSWISLLDVIGLAITALGTGLVIKAKIDLGKCHSWTGYCFKNSSLKFHGVYAYIRHPLYTGIFLYALGGLVILIPHVAWYFSAIVLFSLAYILPFIAYLARKETLYLTEAFGASFLDYKSQVHAFLPLRKYSTKPPSTVVGGLLGGKSSV
ncbi:MAG: hypothetical protein NWE93_03840 [Candidatus Bathyarchaeota archaeon]|nr:hypothetical protein [Candidatus Bathyarchaeota archaeon]